MAASKPVLRALARPRFGVLIRRNSGYSAAISYVFFAIIIILGVAQALITRRRKDVR